jgi:pyrroline-5-carboxylate reductase
MGFVDYMSAIAAAPQIESDASDAVSRRDVPRNLGVLGVGAIAEAMVTGLCEGQEPPSAVHLSPRNAERASRLAGRYAPAEIAESNQAVVDRAEVVLVCVRPGDASPVLSDLAFRAEHVVISVMAGLPVDALRPLVPPTEVIVRAIPLPAVARREGLTAIHPDHELARGTFEPLGGVIALDDERAFDTLSAASATLAAHLAYLDSISRWLVRRGIPEADAARYVTALFAGVTGMLLASETSDFAALADDHATLGGYNEQFREALRRVGTFDEVGRALDDVARRLEGE